MIASENETGRAARFIAVATSAAIPSRVVTEAAAMRTRASSSMTIAPSTSKPKSMAPSDIRFPVTPMRTMPITAIAIASGMASATINEPRKLPRVRKRTTTTSNAPSPRLMATVLSIRLMNSARS